MIYRRYIAMARDETYTPTNYTDELMLRDITGNTLSVCDLEWQESKPIASVIYKVMGYVGSEQFKRCIVEQPSWIQNLVICSQLRQGFGDISDVRGFDKKGNFNLVNYHDVIIPRWADGQIVALETFATRQLVKGIL